MAASTKTDTFVEFIFETVSKFLDMLQDGIASLVILQGPVWCLTSALGEVRCVHPQCNGTSER